MKVVETENLTKIYHFGDVEVTALNRVNLEIAEHEFVAVWGPSGSGKSTFCNLIGLLDVPTAGEVRIREQSAAKLSDGKRSKLRNQYIGFVFQNFNLVPVLSALENVMLPLQIMGVKKKVAAERARKLLDEVDLSDRANHRPQKLSGGQQQRVAIARALVSDPLLVIADEPTANLDTGSANRIVNLMRKINETRGAAFVFSTHDDRLLDRVDRKIHLQDGMVVEDHREERAGAAPQEGLFQGRPPTPKTTPISVQPGTIPRPRPGEEIPTQPVAAPPMPQQIPQPPQQQQPAAVSQVPVPQSQAQPQQQAVFPQQQPAPLPQPVEQQQQPQISHVQPQVPEQSPILAPQQKPQIPAEKNPPTTPVMGAVQNPASVPRPRPLPGEPPQES